MARCKRSFSIERRVLAAAAPGESLVIPADAVSFTLRVVDNASPAVPVAFSVAHGSDPANRIDFDAGEVFQEDDLKLAGDLELKVDSATATDTAELLVWTA